PGSVTLSSSADVCVVVWSAGGEARVNTIQVVTAERSEATNMENVASGIGRWPDKDNRAINMDMVRPIPAKSPTPIICAQDAPCGIEPIRSRIASLVIR